MSERFEAELLARRSGTVLEVPFDVKERFGRARAPVRVTINGHTFRTTVAVYGGRYLIGLSKQVRERAAVSVGDRFDVDVAADDEPRTIEPPSDLSAALDADANARAAFDALSFTHRKEYVRWIEEAKREETRATRIQKAVAMLRDGVKHP